MELIEQHVDFEKSALILSCGSIFQAHKEVTHRWLSTLPSVYGPSGLRCRILYQLRDERFVLVSSEACTPKEGYSASGQRSLYWHCEQPPTGKYVEPIDAVGFLVEIKATIPACLEAALTEYAARQREQARGSQQGGSVWPPGMEAWGPREAWKDRCLREAKDANFDEIVRETHIAGVRLIEALKRRQAGRSDDPPTLQLCAEDMAVCLLCEYHVLPENWWGDAMRHPPDYVEVTELPWPVPLVKMRDLIKELQNLVAEPCRRLMNYHASFTHALIKAQRASVIEALIHKVNDIERVVSALGAKTPSTSLRSNRGTPRMEAPKMSRYISLALAAFERAEAALVALGAGRVTDDDAYQWLQEQGPDDYELPALKSWKRYVRLGRSGTGQQKNVPRAGRTGRSVIKADELD